MRKVLKYGFSTGLLIAIMLFLMGPLMQHKANFISIAPLHGSYAVVEKPEFTLVTWFDGSFQVQMEDYLKDHFGFRNLSVRFNNQSAFWLYKEARANGVEVGVDNFLYESHYIKAYFGDDFSGKKFIQEKVRKLGLIRDTLEQKGIDLIVVIAPGKASFYPDFFPEEYDESTKHLTNYAYYGEQFIRHDINYLDFKSWFLNMKDTATYPLFPKTGIHWSKYGELIAGDSIARFVGELRGVKMPHWQISGIDITQEVRETDDDIEKGMNLIFDIPDLEMGYPIYTLETDSDSVLPKVVTIGDSYYWGIFNYGLSRDMFNEGQFWFYNKQIYPDSYESEVRVQELSIIEEIEKNDVVLILSSDASLFHFAFGFIDELYAAYYPSKEGL